MTNNERDALLINLATSVNNIQNTLNDFRTENKAEHDALRAEMSEMDNNIRTDMKKMDQDIRTDIKAEMKKMNQELRNEIKKSADNTIKELKDYIAFDDTGITEMFRDVWKREAKRDQRLDNHDEEIRKIKSKLA